MKMSLTVLSQTVNDNIEFLYSDGVVIINYRGEDALDGSIDLDIRDVIALKTWCEWVISEKGRS